MEHKKELYNALILIDWSKMETMKDPIKKEILKGHMSQEDQILMKAEVPIMARRLLQKMRDLDLIKEDQTYRKDLVLTKEELVKILEGLNQIKVDQILRRMGDLAKKELEMIKRLEDLELKMVDK